MTSWFSEWFDGLDCCIAWFPPWPLFCFDCPLEVVWLATNSARLGFGTMVRNHDSLAATRCRTSLAPRKWASSHFESCQQNFQTACRERLTPATLSILRGPLAFAVARLRCRFARASICPIDRAVSLCGGDADTMVTPRLDISRCSRRNSRLSSYRHSASNFRQIADSFESVGVRVFMGSRISRGKNGASGTSLCIDAGRGQWSGSNIRITQRTVPSGPHRGNRPLSRSRRSAVLP